MKIHLALATLLLTGCLVLADTLSVPGDFPTIQMAIDSASDNDLILVDSGDWVEQLNISKAVTIEGAGVGLTNIVSPDVLTLYFTTSNDNYPIVFIHDTPGATLRDLTVDGAGKGNANYRFVGVGAWNAGGTLENVEVLNVRDTPFSGAQHGVGVYTFNNTGGPYEFSMDDVLVEDFQKTAVVIGGAGMTGWLTNVQTLGAGPTDVTAQNGIQIAYDASGTIANCVVADIHYTGDYWTATGILLYAGTAADLDACLVTGCQTSVYFIDTSGTMTDCLITEVAGDALYVYSQGAKSEPGQRVVAQAFDHQLAGQFGRVPISFLMHNCTFEGAGVTNSWGPCVWAAGPVDFTATQCIITGWDWGLVVYEDGDTVTGACNLNCLGDNFGYGFYAETAGAFDAIQNWWGDPSGPSGNGPGSGSAVGGNTLFDPWAEEDLCGGTATQSTNWSNLKTLY